MCCFYCYLFRTNKVYRFTSVNSAKYFLKNHSLKLTDPTKFNDPFETKIDYQKSLYTTKFREGRGLERATDFQIVKLDNQLFEKLSSFGVVCFSKTVNNILMWAYYAEDHRGICFEFDINKDPYFFSDLHIVEYKNQFGTINVKDEKWDYIDILASKAECWRHEAEMRVVKEGADKIPDRLWTINPKAIKSIIFGCNLADYRDVNDNRLQDYKDIIELLKQPEYSHLEKKQMQLDLSEYKLHCKKVPFFVYEKNDGGVVVISFDEQQVFIEEILEYSENVIYSAPMCKREELNIKLKDGYYFVSNGGIDKIKLYIKH